MLNETWEDQYRRLRRAYERLQTAGAEVSDPDVDPRDVLLVFCSEALALMYWPQNLPGTADVRGLIYRDRDSDDWSVSLAICADIANAAKHAQLRKRSAVTGRADGWADIASRRITIQKGQTRGEQQTTRARRIVVWTIMAGGIKYDAQDVAAGAVADWDRWLGRSGFALPRI